MDSIAMNEWRTETTVRDYATQTTNPVVNWYEYEINFPDLEKLIPDTAKTILDFGCGPAEFTEKLSETYDVVGVDIEPMLSIAQKKHPTLSFIEWDGTSPIPERLKKYDVIFSKLVFQFIEDLESVLSNLKKILDSGGVIICSVSNPKKISKKFNIPPDTVQKYDDKVGNTEIKIHPIYRSQEKYIEIFANAGFSVSQISEPLVPTEILQKYNISPDYNAIPSRLNVRFAMQ